MEAIIDNLRTKNPVDFNNYNYWQYLLGEGGGGEVGRFFGGGGRVKLSCVGGSSPPDETLLGFAHSQLP